ncbi:MAG: ABC transporter permease [Gemmataceae bacterium]|nr:ABC transporter permease [Gemmataceae bacterium]
MTWALVKKILRDLRAGLIVVAVLLAAFQLLWARVTDSITGQILPFLSLRMPLQEFQALLFQGPGKIVQTIIGGESIDLTSAFHMMTVGYVHPLIQAILCIWAVGRAAGAIAGEIDRGTMELLLAQPIRRGQIVLAHFFVDLITIPILCLAMWSGTWLGAWAVGFTQPTSANLLVDPWRFGPALLNIALLVFATGGLTMWLSSAGRFRMRVLGIAILVMLVQFLVNLIGQLWDKAEWLRPFTLFYYFQPQEMIIHSNWAADTAIWLRLFVLLAVGSAGYGLAAWTFCRRDLPAPL